MAALVALSALARWAVVRRYPAPWIWVDELVYSELARSLADGGHLRIRDVEFGRAFGVVYPALLAPVYAAADTLPRALAAVKIVNAAVISLAAVPAYLLARRLVDARAALLAAALAVSLPALLYAGMVMTENAFLPVILAAALALARVLERPTWLGSLLFVALCALAFLVRVQAVVLVPTALSAPLLMAAWERSARRLRTYVPLYAAVGGAVIAAFAWTALRGRSPASLLGAYRATTDSPYSVADVARWSLYHLAELDVTTGFAPLAALLVLLLTGHHHDRGVRALVATTATLTAWMTLQVGAFASQPSVLRVEERNLFHVFPLLLTVLVVWARRGAPRPRVTALAAVTTAALLPLALPFERLINVSALSDTFGLLVWWDVHEAGVALGDLAVVAALTGAAVGAAMLVVPARLALVLPAGLLVFLVASNQSVDERVRPQSVGALFQGQSWQHRDELDRRVPSGAEVALLWTGRTDYRVVFVNEFFNRSVGRILTTSGPTPGNLPEQPVAVDVRDGLFRAGDGSPIRAPYVLSDATLPVAGRALVEDPRLGVALLQLRGPLRVTHSVEGLYPDTWSGPDAVYRGYRCRGGRLAATVESDATLFRRTQTVVATGTAGQARVRVPPGKRRKLLVPLPSGEATCVVRFRVTPTAVPADEGVSADTRRLGIHFRGFTVLR